MASWKRARVQDRDAAVELINAAYADGQLTEDERADKVSRALVARTLGDVQQTTADLQGPESPAPSRGARERVRDWWRARSRAGRVGVAAAAAALVVGGGVAVLGLPTSDAPVRATPEQYVVEVDAETITDLLAAYAEEFGTTETYGVLVMRDWTRVHVPTEDGRARYAEWTLVDDRELEQSADPLGAGDSRLFDLAEVDTGALERNLARARTRLGVEDVSSVQVVMARYLDAEQAQITINVGNEFAEDAYLVTDLGGRVLDESPYDPAD